jgi:hypothetical protein
LKDEPTALLTWVSLAGNGALLEALAETAGAGGRGALALAACANDFGREGIKHQTLCTSLCKCK